MSGKHSHQRHQNERPQREPRLNSAFDPNDFKAAWINDGITAKAIEFAEEMGKWLKEARFTTSQFRNFYGELKRIQMKKIENEHTSFLLLKPKLAYAAARAKNEGATAFKQVISRAADLVRVGEDDYKARFQNFCDLVEAVLAYHKAFGGKD